MRRSARCANGIKFKTRRRASCSHTAICLPRWVKFQIDEILQLKFSEQKRANLKWSLDFKAPKAIAIKFSGKFKG